MMSLSNRAAVVTGSSEGIGLAVADCLTAAGAAVVLVARDEERLGRAAGTLRRDGRSVTAVAGDITDPHVRQQAVKVCLERYGSVDVLVNNAGMQGPIGPMIEASEDQLHQVLAMNLVSPLLMVREVYEGWMHEHGGVVVNITSFSGLRPGNPRRRAAGGCRGI